MKLVQGETLEETLTWAGSARLEPDFLADLLLILIKVCDAVAFAHSRGILHRDLKPSNVMISDFGQVYVVDWGVARPSRRGLDENRVSSEVEAPSDPSGMLVGTPRYMAPEQLFGQHDQLDERTDVFALGATLYQILTGQPPHDAATLPHFAIRRSTITVPPPEEVASDVAIPPELSRIAMKAMAHDPAERYASVEDLKRDIEAFLRGTWYLPRARFAAALFSWPRDSARTPRTSSSRGGASSGRPTAAAR
jgi:serine/threonine-protein kinase